MYVAGDVITAVVDVGTETTKIGYAGTHLPTTLLSSATYKNEFISPVTRSVVTDVTSYLGIMCDNIPCDAEALVISENTMEKCGVKKEILGYLMEKRLCNSALFVRSGVLDAFSHGKTTALVVSLGGGSTQVCSVVDGFVTCRRQMDVGGFDLTLAFKDVLISSGMDFGRLIDVSQDSTWYERRVEFEKNEISRHVKEEVSDLNNTALEVCYDLPVGSVNIRDWNEIPHRLVEVTKLIVEVIETNVPETRQVLAGNIVLVGGGTGIKGIDMVISLRLGQERPRWKSKVFMERNRFSTFQGGSIVGSMGSTKALHIGVGDYEEYGDNILERKKCDWILENP